MSTALLCFTVWIVLLHVACSKKENTCGHSVNYYPPRVVFKGYSSSDLSKVAITIYDSSFNNKLETDTFDFSTATFSGDTAYAQRGTFFSIQTGKCYEINVLAQNKTHKISNVRKGVDDYSWTQKEVCSMGTSVPENRPYLFDLDGQLIDKSGWVVYLVN